jgi:hypothetical protein
MVIVTWSGQKRKSEMHGAPQSSIHRRYGPLEIRMLSIVHVGGGPGKVMRSHIYVFVSRRDSTLQDLGVPLRPRRPLGYHLSTKRHAWNAVRTSPFPFTETVGGGMSANSAQLFFCRCDFISATPTHPCDITLAPIPFPLSFASSIHHVAQSPQFWPLLL